VLLILVFHPFLIKNPDHETSGYDTIPVSQSGSLPSFDCFTLSIISLVLSTVNIKADSVYMRIMTVEPHLHLISKSQKATRNNFRWQSGQYTHRLATLILALPLECHECVSIVQGLFHRGRWKDAALQNAQPLQVLEIVPLLA
jgi:hypothetical protein